MARRRRAPEPVINDFFLPQAPPPAPTSRYEQLANPWLRAVTVQRNKLPHSMKIAQVWFTRPIQAIPNAPTYIGVGPEWANYRLETSTGAVMVTHQVGQGKRTIRHVPLEHVVAYELEE